MFIQWLRHQVFTDMMSESASQAWKAIVVTPVPVWKHCWGRCAAAYRMFLSDCLNFESIRMSIWIWAHESLPLRIKRLQSLTTLEFSLDLSHKWTMTRFPYSHVCESGFTCTYWNLNKLKSWLMISGLILFHCHIHLWSSMTVSCTMSIASTVCQDAMNTPGFSMSLSCLSLYPPIAVHMVAGTAMGRRSKLWYSDQVDVAVEEVALSDRTEMKIWYIGDISCSQFSDGKLETDSG